MFKNIIILFLLLISITQIACSMGSRSIRDHSYVRAITKTFFWPTAEKGVWLSQTCIKRKRDDSCKKWKKRYLRTDLDWEFIRNSKFILIQENMVIGDL